MQRDGKIDYRNYTLSELREALSGIDEGRYPINLENLKAEIAARQNSVPSSDDIQPKGAEESTSEPEPVSVPPWYVSIPMAGIYLLALFTAFINATCQSDGCIAAGMMAFVTIYATAAQLFIVLPIFACLRARRGQEVVVSLLRCAGASLLPTVLVFVYVVGWLGI
jgi:hypothetical protein